MRRTGFILFGMLVLSLAAFGLAEVTLGLGHRGGLTDDTSVRPSVSPKATPTPSLVSTPTPTASPVPVVTPAPTPAAATATTISFVHMRAGASTSTPIVIDLNGGSVLTLGSYADSQWQQVYYGGRSGYVFKAYLSY